MSQSSNPRIFLVDDDEDDQFLLQLVLRQHTPTAWVQVLNNGEELLTALAVERPLPDLVLLDLNMPLMGGLEALAHIRADETCAHLPVIILTTSDNEWDRQKAHALQANEYLVKPNSPDQLNRLIMMVKRRWLSTL